MAIDNEDKRRSVESFMFSVTDSVPDDDIDEGDRAQISWVYRDFDFDEPASGGGRGGGRMMIGIID